MTTADREGALPRLRDLAAYAPPDTSEEPPLDPTLPSLRQGPRPPVVGSATGMTFYLGCHRPSWLSTLEVPLCISRRLLAGRRSLPRASARWVLDSGGFSELSLYGSWRTTPECYAGEVRRFQSEIGQLEWAAIQDWMCEAYLVKKTGLTVGEHQNRTVASYLRLRDLDPTLPWLPVIQGYTLSEYLRHVDDYDRANVDLRQLPTVGLGSVCRRHATAGVAEVIRRLSALGVRLHGFGIKSEGLRRSAPLLHSADSMAWSFRARRSEPLPGHTHKSCANCAEFALLWRERLLACLPSIPSAYHQLSLDVA